MSKKFKAKVLKPFSLRPNSKQLLPGEIVEVDNQTLGGLITRGEAKFHDEDTKAKKPEAKKPESEQETGPTVDELKTTLDERGVNYRSNAKKKALEKLVNDTDPAKFSGDNLLG